MIRDTQGVSSHAIEAHGVRRIYKSKGTELVALDGVDLTVESGELFGLLGPNGAGKTTLIKILTTLLLPSSGTARVAGYDVEREALQVRMNIAMVAGGESSGFGLLTVRENLWMFSQFYGLDRKLARQRIDTMLEIVGLADRADTKVSHLSTGLRQKMNFCRGFITDPTILFLDEPTLGLDVEAARVLRSYTQRWIEETPGKTVLLTTHYMQEADEMCDRVAIINSGRILACDTPSALKRQLQQDVIFHLHTTPVNGALTEELRALGGVRNVTLRQEDGRSQLGMALADDGVLGEVLSMIGSHGGSLLGLEKREPTLEDVFVSLVGHRLEE